MKLTLEQLATENKDGKIPAIEVCKVSAPLVFSHTSGRWIVSQDTDPEFVMVANKLNEYHFSIWKANGDVVVFRNTELQPTDNQVDIADKYRELGLLT
jgi:hypothetical protein